MLFWCSLKINPTTVTDSSKKLFSRSSFITLLVLGSVAIGYKILRLRRHEVFAFSYAGNVFFIWIPLVICFVIGISGLVRYQKSREGNDLIISLLPVLFTLLVTLLKFFEARESHNPVVFQISNMNVAGDICLQLKTKNLYTLLKDEGSGYSWFEGTYAIHEDTILLNGETGMIGNRLLIRRNAFHCPESAAYQDKTETAFYAAELPVVVDSLFCRSKVAGH
jgi:hypothetical protein